MKLKKVERMLEITTLELRVACRIIRDLRSTIASRDKCLIELKEIIKSWKTS